MKLRTLKRRAANRMLANPPVTLRFFLDDDVQQAVYHLIRTRPVHAMQALRDYARRHKP